MSLLSQSPAAPSPESVTQSMLKGAARPLYLSAQAAQKQAIRHVWQNQFGLTPQQVCDALGSDAKKLFQFHGALTDFLLTVAALDGITPDIGVPTNAFTLNPDGTVTVLETPYS